MKIPDIPTDNLYKFMCFAGLLLFIISPFYFYTFTHKVFLKKMDLEMEIALSKTKMEYLKEDVDILEKDVDKAVKNLDILEKAVDEAGKKVKISEDLSKNLENKIIGNQIIKKEIKNKISRLRGVQKDLRMDDIKVYRLEDEVSFLIDEK